MLGNRDLLLGACQHKSLYFGDVRMLMVDDVSCRDITKGRQAIDACGAVTSLVDYEFQGRSYCYVLGYVAVNEEGDDYCRHVWFAGEQMLDAWSVFEEIARAAITMVRQPHADGAGPWITFLIEKSLTRSNGLFARRCKGGRLPPQLSYVLLSINPFLASALAIGNIEPIAE